MPNDDYPSHHKRTTPRNEPPNPFGDLLSDDYSYTPEFTSQQQSGRLRRLGDGVVGTVTTVSDGVKDLFAREPDLPPRYTSEYDSRYDESLDDYYARQRSRDGRIKRRRRNRVLAGGVAVALAATGTLGFRALHGDKDSSADGNDVAMEVVEDELSTGNPLNPGSSTLPQESLEMSVQEILSPASPVETVLSSPAEASSGNLPRYFDADAIFDAEIDRSRCESINVELPTAPSREAVVGGSKTDFALERDEFDSLYDDITATSTIEEVQSIVDNVFRSYMVNVDFVDGVEVPDIEQYKTYMKNVLRSLTYVPADMLVVNTTHQLVFNSDQIVMGQSYANGEYDPYIDTVYLGPTANETTVIHEWAHAVHDYICINAFARDKQLIEVFDEFMQGKLNDPRYVELNEIYQRVLYGTGEMTPEENDEFNALNRVGSLENAYVSSNYAEMFAVIFADIVKNGYLYPDSAGDEEGSDAISYKLQELVIERMQAAMPDVNVSEWLQYISYLNERGMLNSNLNADQILGYSPSEYDLKFAHASEHGVDAVADFHPAIALVDGDHTDYIYSYYDRNQGHISIDVMITGDAELDEKIRIAAEKYLERFLGSDSFNTYYMNPIQNGSSETVGASHTVILAAEAD